MISDSRTGYAKEEFSGERMLFLPGGQWQVPAIQIAQQMGFFVICADGTDSPPGFSVADRSAPLRLQDIEGLVKIGQEFGVSAVMTEQTDFAVPIVARVADALNLRGIPIDVADRATNKGLMRESAANAGVPQPRFRVCQNGREVKSAIADLGLPLFHKPVDGQSSRGVGILTSDADDSIEAALSRSLHASVAGAAIFEEFLKGTECTVEGFVVDGNPTTLAISSKEHYSDLPGVARTLTYPAAFPPKITDQIKKANETAVNAIGITFGMTHAEFIVDEKGQPFLVEIAARGGGSRITSHIVPAVSGFEPVPALIRLLMGSRVQVGEPLQRAAQLRFLRLQEGRRIERIPTMAEFRDYPGVIEIMLPFKNGQRVPKVIDDRSRHGFAITCGETREKAIALADEIENKINSAIQYS